MKPKKGIGSTKSTHSQGPRIAIRVNEKHKRVLALLPGASVPEKVRRWLDEEAAIREIK